MNKASAIKIMLQVFNDMDRDFTIYEYRDEIKYLLEYVMKSPDGSEIKDLLFPMVEQLHNVTHSYMKDKINSAECRVKQIDILDIASDVVYRRINGI